MSEIMTEKICYEVPAVALRGLTILPNMIINFDVSRARSIAALEAAMLKDQMLFVVTQRKSDVENPTIDDLYHYGTMVKIKQLAKLPNKTIRVLVEGKYKARLNQMIMKDPYLYTEVNIEEKVKNPWDEIESKARMRFLHELLENYARLNTNFSKELVREYLDEDDIVNLVQGMCANLPMEYKERQKLLETENVEECIQALGTFMASEVDVIKINKELQEKVRERVDKNQKEYILREQLKVIREELGEDNTLSEAEEFLQKAKLLEAPEQVKEKLIKEIDRYKTSSSVSAENGVLRGYIETLLDMPWDKCSADNKDLKKVKDVLEEDHYGLFKVKERIIEYLAVRLLTGKGDAPILCLVGPPGTGKSSIAKSVARALDKAYVRISLGGVRDEAEIRGHRKTYVGAMPGRIAAAIRQAGVKNPVMLLDEVDKASNDYKGDTFSALLEVLDSEQNEKFRDHYIELPIDLSEVLFIATANSLSTIPGPLLDRMEIIEVSSYTENEKLHIAKEHLVPKQLKKHGLKKKQLSITDKGLMAMIMHYTREAGVRNLERRIGDVCRKAARAIWEEEKKSLKVTDKNIEKYLGKEKYTFDEANEKDEVGIVRGLAWTSVGGVTLSVEVNVIPGKGEFKLTGQLGDVMKESAVTGISYIRAIAPKYGIDKDYFEQHDIHIHIPEGATPKDGPSAGITMATAMLSAITEQKIRADVAMTGEITLRGRVLPIGGLKEKILAAKMAKIKTVIVPLKNKMDVEELEKEILEGIEILFVSDMEEVLEIAFR